MNAVVVRFRLLAAVIGSLASFAHPVAGQDLNGTGTKNAKAPPKFVVAKAATILYGSGTLTDEMVRMNGRVTDKLTFAVTNKTASLITYSFNSGQQFDVTIDNQSGVEVWSLAKSRMFPTQMSRMMLKPGDSHVYSCSWNRRTNDAVPAPPGTYSATATLLAAPRFVVTGTPLVDVQQNQDDPTRIGATPPPGVPSRLNGGEGGSITQTNITPVVRAATTIVIRSK